MIQKTDGNRGWKMNCTGHGMAYVRNKGAVDVTAACFCNLI